MTNDLHAALAALGREEREGAPTLPIDTLTARAHRTRTVHAAAYSAIGVGAAAVLTLGALTADGLWRDVDTPVPPATDEPRQTPGQTPTATPTPTPTPTQTAWEPNWDLCGMPAEELYASDTSWDAEAETGWWLDSTWPYDTVVPVDGVLSLILGLFGAETARVTVEVEVSDVVAVEIDHQTGDGHVAGVAASPTGDVFRAGATDEGVISFGDWSLRPLGSVETRLVSCDASPLTGGDGALDTDLTGDDYDVVAVAGIRPEGGKALTAVGYVGHLGVYPEWPEEPVAGGPSAPGWDTSPAGPLTVGTPLRLGTTVTWNNTNQSAARQEEWCGAALSPPPIPPDPVPGIALTSTGFRDGDELVVQLTVTNNRDDPISDAKLAYPYVQVLRDGRIVGLVFPPGMAPFTLPSPLHPGESVQLEMSLGPFTCTFMKGEPWPAGTYDLAVEAYLLWGPTLHAYSVRTTFPLD